MCTCFLICFSTQTIVRFKWMSPQKWRIRILNGKDLYNATKHHFSVIRWHITCNPEHNFHRKLIDRLRTKSYCLITSIVNLRCSKMSTFWFSPKIFIYSLIYVLFFSTYSHLDVIQVCQHFLQSSNDILYRKKSQGPKSGEKRWQKHNYSLGFGQKITS